MKTFFSISTTVFFAAVFASTAALAQPEADDHESFAYFTNFNGADAAVELRGTAAVFTGASFSDGHYQSVEAYFADSIDFPEEGLTKGARGTVTVWFEISPDGSLGASRIDHSPGAEFDAAVEECLRNMPRWTPARMGTKAVKSTQAVRLNFRLQ